MKIYSSKLLSWNSYLRIRGDIIRSSYLDISGFHSYIVEKRVDASTVQLISRSKYELLKENINYYCYKNGSRHLMEENSKEVNNINQILFTPFPTNIYLPKNYNVGDVLIIEKEKEKEESRDAYFIPYIIH
jgi:hypothetical protein